MIISTKCGKGNCPFYDETNHTSKCSKFTDRNECSLSISHRNNVSKRSSLKQKYWWKY